MHEFTRTQNQTQWWTQCEVRRQTSKCESELNFAQLIFPFHRGTPFAHHGVRRRTPNPPRHSEDNREFMNEEVDGEVMPTKAAPHGCRLGRGFSGANKANENRVFLNWHYVECLKFTYYIIHHNTCAPCHVSLHFPAKNGRTRCWAWDVTIGKIENGAIVPVLINTLPHSQHHRRRRGRQRRRKENYSRQTLVVSWCSQQPPHL